MMAELDADGKHNSEQISEIDLTDPEDARVLMPEQGADILAHFGEDHFLERYQRYQAHIAEWRQQYPHLAAVDLRYDHQVVLEMVRAMDPARRPQAAMRRRRTLTPSAAPDAKASSAPAARKYRAETIGREKVECIRANKSKPAQDKKHAAPPKRAASRAQRSGTPLPQLIRQRRPRAAKIALNALRSSRRAGERMGQKQDNLIVVLDIGSAWTRVLAADVNEGAALSRARRGGVGGNAQGADCELAPAAKAVRAANEQAERVARANIDECVVGIGGPHVRGSTPMADSSWAAACARLRARTCAPPWAARAPSSAPPIAKFCTCCRGSSSSTSSPASSIRWAWWARGLKSSCTSPPAPAARCKARSPAPIALGLRYRRRCWSRSPPPSARFRPTSANWACACSTSARIPAIWRFFSRAQWRLHRVGPHRRRALHQRPRHWIAMPMAQAEDLKRQYGNAVVTAVPQLAEIEIANAAAAASLRMRTMAEILEPRARELMYYVKESLRYGGVVDALGAGCVLTGGGAMLPGMLDVTESQLRVPARIGFAVRCRTCLRI
jgi:cell division protein FtsA